jgi:CheY-like chemotaxis protein
VRPGAYHQVTKPHVLVVDDYMHTREMYAEFLEFVGFRVTAAENARSAIEKARRRKPSLVVMDLALPDMPGWKAASILRSDARTKDVPIIAVTAYSETHAREIALESGCNVFLEKPVGPNALADLIKELIA